MSCKNEYDIHLFKTANPVGIISCFSGLKKILEQTLKKVQIKVLLIPYIKYSLGLKIWVWTVILSSTQLLPKKSPSNICKANFPKAKRKRHLGMHGIPIAQEDAVKI